MSGSAAGEAAGKIQGRTTSLAAPLMAPLAALMARGEVAPAALLTIVEARHFDLDPAPPEDMVALCRYAAATGGTVMEVAAGLLGENTPLKGAALAGGTAWALVGLLRAVAFHGARGRVYLPASLLRRAGISRDELCAASQSGPSMGGARRREMGRRLAPVAAAIAEEASRRLAEAQAAIPRGHRCPPALLPAALAAVMLKRLARRRYDLFATGEMAKPLRQWHLWLAARGRWGEGSQ